MFYGIIISIYYLDNKSHNKPHIHVKYQEYEAVISLPEGDILEGEIPPRGGRGRCWPCWRTHLYPSPAQGGQASGDVIPSGAKRSRGI